MRTNVYVDGFNFYYGCFKNQRDPWTARLQRYKWLDFRKLAEALFPHDQIHRIQYFTARVSGTPNDPGQPVRQQTYLRALETVPRLRIHFGTFQPAEKWGMQVHPPVATPLLVKVSTHEEKGSDVNLATYLLQVGYEGDYEQAVVMTNDSDLAEPIRVVTRSLMKPVIVLSPYPTVTRDLRRAATSAGLLDKSIFASCQFPATLTDRRGKSIIKPRSW